MTNFLFVAIPVLIKLVVTKVAKLLNSKAFFNKLKASKVAELFKSPFGVRLHFCISLKLQMNKQC